MKNVEVINLARSLAQVGNVKMKLSNARKLLAIRQHVDSAAIEIEQKRVELVKRHGKDKGDGNFQVDQADPEAMKQFVDQYAAFLQLDSEITVEKLPSSTFDNLHVSIDELAALSPILAE